MLFCNKSVSFNPKVDIPSLEGKVILVTGGNSGLGKQSVLELSRHAPSQIWLAARNLDKARETMDEILAQVPNAPIKILELDLASLESVKAAAATFTAESDRLDILMLNAGIMATSPGLTEEGYELQFGTNHMGHAFLAKLLLPVLETTAKTGDVRIVALSSSGHALWWKSGFDYESLKTTAESLGPNLRYFRSKLANVLWARQMAKLYPQFTVAAVHPGVVQTNLVEGSSGLPSIVRSLVRVIYRLLATLEDGVKNQLWAAVSNDVESGAYYDPIGIRGLTSWHGTNDELAREVWDWTEKELSPHV